MNQLTIVAALPWYLPSFYGDIRLESTAKGTTILYEGLTASEAAAMAKLRKRAMGGIGRRPWCQPSEFKEELGSGSSGQIVLAASIDAVQAVLAKALKPGRSLVTAVRFSDGSLEEKTKELESYRVNAKGGTDEKKEKKSKELTAATTVAAPDKGCPLPAFERAEIRATRVLEAFLTEEQIEDFRTRQQYVAVGADTGHRYMLTSRHAGPALRRTGGMSLYDLDEERPLCVHDWLVPAAEELLGLTCFLGLPGRESYVRDIPEHA